jgi:hypothetical protein
MDRATAQGMGRKETIVGEPMVDEFLVSAAERSDYADRQLAACHGDWDSYDLDCSARRQMKETP